MDRLAAGRGTLTRRELRLYFALLAEAISGPHARDMRIDLGTASKYVYEALKDRVWSRLSSTRDEEFELDPIDWAALRALVPVALKRHYPPEFKTVTTFTFDDVAALGRKVEEAIREFRTPHMGISYQHGRCLVVLPVEWLGRGVSIVGVPDEASWDRLVPECARGRRDEILHALRTHFESRWGEWHWQERAADSMEELEAWVRAQRPDSA